MPGAFATRATAGQARTPRSKILYDVTALKFPASALYPAAATSGDGRTETLLGPVPGSSGAHVATSAAQDGASVATSRAGDGASQALLAPASDSGNGGGSGAGAGAEAGDGAEGGDAGDDNNGGAPAPVDLSVSKRWAVTLNACYQLKVRAALKACRAHAVTDGSFAAWARACHVRARDCLQAVFGLRDGQECSVCLVNAKSVVLMPCRHMCVCETCFTHLDKCPVCRGPYTSHLTFREPVGVGGSDSDSSDASGNVRDAAVAPSAAPVSSTPSGAQPTVVVVSSSAAVAGSQQPATPSSDTVPPLML